MATSTDFEQEYQRAEAAYMDGNYEDAAALVYQLVENFPADPSARLLCGHIYCYGLHQYEVAGEQYRAVLSLTDEQSLVEHAHNGIAYTDQLLANELPAADLPAEVEDLEEMSIFQDSAADFASNPLPDTELEDPALTAELDLGSLELEGVESYDPDPELLSPFAGGSDGSGGIAAYADGSSELDEAIGADFEDPFALDPVELAGAEEENPDWLELGMASTELLGGTGSNVAPASRFEPLEPSLEAEELDRERLSASDRAPTSEDLDEVFTPFELPAELDLDSDYTAATPAPSNGRKLGFAAEGNRSGPATLDPIQSSYSVAEDDTLLMGGSHLGGSDAPRQRPGSKGYGSQSTGSTSGKASYPDGNGFNIPESFDLDAFDDDVFSDSFPLGDEEETRSFGSVGLDSDLPLTGSRPKQMDFLEEFDDFDDIGNLRDFDVDDGRNSRLSTGSSGFGNISSMVGSTTSNLDFGDNSDGSAIRDDEIFSISSASAEAVPSFTQIETEPVDATVTVEQGSLAFLENASIQTKQLYTALGAGLISLVAVAAVSNVASFHALKQNKPEVISELRQTGWIMTAAAGVTSFLTAWGIGTLAGKQIKKSADNLQNQFDAISQGNLEARATVFAEDEFGKMSAKFNQMAKVILTTTSEARRKAEEQEQAKEDLQRQVIRLLDDVEGAARGDLTVQAEVTADVLGAVADSFNLTIQNLREIVFQVKSAAREVSKGATDSATFAQGLSSDALRQAEELAATLNSVQVLTDAIQRVAESAREAEEVARGAAATANRGGEAVERTVAGILEIRETVAETTRKVKRLAEASQEISKIVALIATIASRTNLLALNASIEAARAGEAGRGFAIVADEVRQLADRSAKSLKEIEQIVMQIQSETGAVMTAMEEGTQQVIEGTRLAEQAKRSLEDIIQVTNRIDVLVRSITADTVEQNETARAVAQVMQAVELTAQETSQESQRVYGSLQNLVGVARDLLTSVERFRVETTERQ